jgi:hypothetical protein
MPNNRKLTDEQVLQLMRCEATPKLRRLAYELGVTLRYAEQLRAQSVPRGLAVGARHGIVKPERLQRRDPRPISQPIPGERELIRRIMAGDE